MATLKQINANRRNAKKSTGPKTPEGKERVRFNALVHGSRAESVVTCNEDPAQLQQRIDDLMSCWKPQDEMEKSFVEQIAVNQWKLARLDRAEALLYESGLDPVVLALSLHRIGLTQARMLRSISSTVADLERYRKARLPVPTKESAKESGNAKDNDKQKEKDKKDPRNAIWRAGLIWGSGADAHYEALPEVRGLDGLWRQIPRELLGDTSTGFIPLHGPQP